jgi:hypothetical protein
VPAHPVDRLDWQHRAASIGAYRDIAAEHGQVFQAAIAAYQAAEHRRRP